MVSQWTRLYKIRYMLFHLQRGDNLSPPLTLPFETPGGMQKLQCWNVPGVLRLIQSIPSPKAEPFKRWFAKVPKRVTAS
jgi:prophage antirepressor-like protein